MGSSNECPVPIALIYLAPMIRVDSESTEVIYQDIILTIIF